MIMKKTYETPSWEINQFRFQDVLTMSGVDEGNIIGDDPIIEVEDLWDM